MDEPFTNRYTLLERIAVGDSAEVFRAKQVEGEHGKEYTERPVAIKRALPRFSKDDHFRRLFQQEAAIAKTVDHPNIVRVLEHGQLQNSCYVVKELVEGQDLARLLATSRSERRPLTATMAAYIAAQVAYGLVFIHQLGDADREPLNLVHGGISPRDILVSWGGEVRLPSLGIARTAVTNRRAGQGVARGKLDYMAPEQARVSEMDQRVDIFALGCVLYEMVEGGPPFRGENELATLDRLQKARVRFPFAQLEIPEQLQAILERSLATDPARRYPSAEAMAMALEDFCIAERLRNGKKAVARWARALEMSADLLDLDEEDLPEALRKTPWSPEDELGPEEVDPLHTRVTAKILNPLGLEGPPRQNTRRLFSLLPPLMVAVALVGWLIWCYLGNSSSSRGQGSDPASTTPLHKIPLPRQTKAPLPPGRTTLAAAKGLEVVWLVSTPSGANVSVDGRLVGPTPIRLPIRNRSLSVQMHKPGFEVWKGEIPYPPPTDVIKVRLERIFKDPPTAPTSAPSPGSG